MQLQQGVGVPGVQAGCARARGVRSRGEQVAVGVDFYRLPRIFGLLLLVRGEMPSSSVTRKPPINRVNGARLTYKYVHTSS
jgi:hypothetical protein